MQLRGPDGRIREVAVPPGADPDARCCLRRLRRRADARRRADGLRRAQRHRARPDLARALRPEHDHRPGDLAGRRRRRRPSRSATATTCCCGPPRARPASASSCAGTSTRVWPSGAGAWRSSPPTGSARACARSCIDPRSRRIVFRGPPGYDVSSLSFDGRTIAFALPGCLIAGPAGLAPHDPARPVLADRPRRRQPQNSARTPCSVRVALHQRAGPPLPRRGARRRRASGRSAGRLDARVPTSEAHACSRSGPEPSRPRRPRAAHGPRRGSLRRPGSVRFECAPNGTGEGGGGPTPAAT